MDYWIRIHWFEVSALILLGLNLWFVFEVLTVLRRVKDGLLLLAQLLDVLQRRTKSERHDE